MMRYKRVNATFRTYAKTKNLFHLSVDLDDKDGLTISMWLARLEEMKNTQVIWPSAYYLSYFVVMDVVEEEGGDGAD